MRTALIALCSLFTVFITPGHTAQQKTVPAHVTWSASPSPEVISYIVYSGIIGATPSATKVPATSLAATVACKPNTTYRFYVIADAGNGVVSVPSNVVTFKTPRR